MTTICKICGKECKSLGSHINKHNISCKEYYDMFLRKPNEGKCIICGKDTTFKTLKVGYIGRYCSSDCWYGSMSKNPTKWKRNRQKQIKQFERDNDCTSATKLIKKYGHEWYTSNIVDFIFMNKHTKFVPNNQIYKITDYVRKLNNERNALI